MYNVNPFDLIISEPFVELDGEGICKVIGFEISTGEQLVLFRGTVGECQNFIRSVEATALAQLRHYHQLMDKFVMLDRELDYVKEELREQQEAYDRLLADYDDLDHKFQYEVAKNDKSLGCTGQLDNDLLLQIATGKTSRCDAIRLLVQLYGLDFDEARRYVHKVMAED
jgi:hypothetical protein